MRLTLENQDATGQKKQAGFEKMSSLSMAASPRWVFVASLEHKKLHLKFLYTSIR